MFLPPKEAKPVTLEVVMDKYLKNSSKECTRRKRGKLSTHVYITGLGQKMPQGNSWHSLLNNNDNKNDLIHLFVLFLKLDDVRMKLCYPVIVREKESTWKITTNYVHQMFSCNHEEPDTRMVLHGSLDDVDCVVCSKDTDVLLLLAFAYNKK